MKYITLPLLLLLVGCASDPRIIEKEVPVSPPAWLLAPCPDEEYTVTTFLDGLTAAEAYRAERNYCALQVQLLRWYLQEATPAGANGPSGAAGAPTAPEQ